MEVFSLGRNVVAGSRSTSVGAGGCAASVGAGSSEDGGFPDGICHHGPVGLKGRLTEGASVISLFRDLRLRPADINISVQQHQQCSQHKLCNHLISHLGEISEQADTKRLTSRVRLRGVQDSNVVSDRVSER